MRRKIRRKIKALRYENMRLARASVKAQKNYKTDYLKKYHRLPEDGIYQELWGIDRSFRQQIISNVDEITRLETIMRDCATDGEIILRLIA